MYILYFVKNLIPLAFRRQPQWVVLRLKRSIVTDLERLHKYSWIHNCLW